MRGIFIIIFCLVAAAVSGQFRITGYLYDSITRKPLPDIYLQVLRNNDKWIDICTTDSAGCFTGEISKKEFSKKSAYQVYIDEDRYNLVRRTVTPGSFFIDTIFLSPNPRYIYPVKDMIYKEAGSTCFGDYEPAEPRNMNELPEHIQKKVEAHLQDKLSPAFYSRLYLSGGQLVNLQRLEKIEHFSREYQWRAWSYYLDFTFSDTSLGIARYSAKLVMDEEGNVMEDIELPCSRDSVYKENIISMQMAKQIARDHCFFKGNTYTDFKYDSDNDCFVWEFSTINNNRIEWTYHNRYMILNAHNGKIIKKEESAGCMPSGNSGLMFGELFIFKQL